MPEEYKPFPDFDEWRNLSVGSAYDRYLTLLRDTRANASAEHVDRARQTAIREAALDTGAIEGLYSTDRGVTQTIAVMGATWDAT